MAADEGNLCEADSLMTLLRRTTLKPQPVSRTPQPDSLNATVSTQLHVKQRFPRREDILLSCFVPVEGKKAILTFLRKMTTFLSIAPL